MSESLGGFNFDWLNDPNLIEQANQMFNGAGALMGNPTSINAMTPLPMEQAPYTPGASNGVTSEALPPAGPYAGPQAQAPMASPQAAPMNAPMAGQPNGVNGPKPEQSMFQRALQFAARNPTSLAAVGGAVGSLFTPRARSAIPAARANAMAAMARNTNGNLAPSNRIYSTPQPIMVPGLMGR